MSSFLFSASITLTLLSILSVSTAILVDTDGEPVTNGGVYYIIPESSTIGLTYTFKQHSGICPLYITDKSNYEYTPGTPVKISSPARTPFISLDDHVDLAFEANTPCGRSLSWGATIDPLSRKFYITVGGFNPIVGNNPFTITKTDNSESSPAVYELQFALGPIPPFNVGLNEDDGLLGSTPEPTKLSFQKAFYGGLKLPSTA